MAARGDDPGQSAGTQEHGAADGPSPPTSPKRPKSPSRRRRLSNNAKTLLFLTFLYAIITAAQLVASVVASSGTLLVDSISMLIDTATYLGNLVAEWRGSKESEALAASGISLAVLNGVAAWGVIQASMDLIEPVPAGAAQVVPGIVLLFGVWGIVFDGLSFWGFYKWGHSSAQKGGHEVVGDGAASPGAARTKSAGSGGQSVGLKDARLDPTNVCVSLSQDSGRAAAGSGAAAGASGAASAAAGAAGVAQAGQGKGATMNMRSALLHVGADLLRSVTTTVEGLVIIYGGAGSRKADAAAMLIVSATILLGGCGAGASWTREARRAKRARKWQWLEDCEEDWALWDNLPAAVDAVMDAVEPSVIGAALPSPDGSDCEDPPEAAPGAPVAGPGAS